MGTNGQGEVTYNSNNCVAYYDEHGYRTNLQQSCTAAQIAQADDAMARHRREQGMDGHSADHSGNVINLVCYGEGHKPTYNVQNTYRWDYDQHKYIHGTETVSGTSDFDTNLQFQFHDNSGRVKLPGSLVPVAHSGGDNGWWTLTDVVITDSTIKAGYRLNGLNKPKLEIDRRSGHISIRGQRTFSGTCDNVDSGQRRF